MSRVARLLDLPSPHPLFDPDQRDDHLVLVLKIYFDRLIEQARESLLTDRINIFDHDSCTYVEQYFLWPSCPLAVGLFLEVKDCSRKRRALDFIICQVECRAHGHLSPSHAVFFDSDRPFQWEDRDGFSIKVFKLRVLRIVTLE